MRVTTIEKFHAYFYVSYGWRECSKGAGAESKGRRWDSVCVLQAMALTLPKQGLKIHEYERWMEGFVFKNMNLLDKAKHKKTVEENDNNKSDVYWPSECRNTHHMAISPPYHVRTVFEVSFYFINW